MLRPRLRTLGLVPLRGRSLSKASEASEKGSQLPNLLIQSAKTKQKWEVVVGLELHAQVLSSTKLFSGSSTTFASPPNTQVSFFDAALPGTLPVINSHCIRQAIKTGLALNAQINLFSTFDRKHYFYLDLPHGYQITQQFSPLVSNGLVELHMDKPSSYTRKVRVQALKLEMDSGKSIHDQHPSLSLVDLNRAGMSLMEIVSDADMRSSTEAGEYVRKVQFLLKHIQTCPANMEDGSLRCDVNVSVRKPGDAFGVRTEIKNLNSIKSLMKAIVHNSNVSTQKDYEVQRHIKLIESGESVKMETLTFDNVAGVTLPMRDKESEADYRFFPEPDLPPLRIQQETIEEIKSNLPEMPDAVRERLLTKYGLPAYDASVLLHEDGGVSYFEQASDGCSPKTISNLITTEIFKHLRKTNKTLRDSPVPAKNLQMVVSMMESGTISNHMAKKIIEHLFEEPHKSPAQIAEERGLTILNDDAELERLCLEALNTNPDEMGRFYKGEKKLLGVFVAEVMRLSNQRANPTKTNQILSRLSSQANH